jgi:hypothetical protein
MWCLLSSDTAFPSYRPQQLGQLRVDWQRYAEPYRGSAGSPKYSGPQADLAAVRPRMKMARAERLTVRQLGDLDFVHHSISVLGKASLSPLRAL